MKKKPNLSYLLVSVLQISIINTSLIVHNKHITYKQINHSKPLLRINVKTIPRILLNINWYFQKPQRVGFFSNYWPGNLHFKIIIINHSIILTAETYAINEALKIISFFNSSNCNIIIIDFLSTFTSISKKHP